MHLLLNIKYYNFFNASLIKHLFYHVSNSSSNSSTDLLANMTSLAIRSTDFIQSSHSGLASGKVIVRWGSNEEMVTKVKVLRALLALPENAHAKLFDLSSPLSPIVK